MSPSERSDDSYKIIDKPSFTAEDFTVEFIRELEQKEQFLADVLQNVFEGHRFSENPEEPPFPTEFEVEVERSDKVSVQVDLKMIKGNKVCVGIQYSLPIEAMPVDTLKTFVEVILRDMVELNKIGFEFMKEAPNTPVLLNQNEDLSLEGEALVDFQPAHLEGLLRHLKAIVDPRP